MDLPEIRFRLSQKVRILRERIAIAKTENLKSDWSTFWVSKRIDESLVRDALECHEESAAELLGHYLIKRLVARFYQVMPERQELLDAYRQLFPGRREQIVEEAEQLCKHRMRIFAYAEVEYGLPLRWRQDVIHGLGAGLCHWSQIPYLDFSRVGDSKITWEPNRHQHFVTLALAYRLTGNESYARECLSQWDDWQCQNPYLCGINWCSSLELAFRAWSWIWMIRLLAGSSTLTGRRVTAIIRSLALHADFISANLSIYFSPNTHLLGEGFALFVIGLLFPELWNSDSYRDKGRQILLNEITRQVREDGSHAEQSTSYHAYATDFFLCAAILADRNSCAFPDSYRAVLKKMIDFMMYTEWPDGSHPMIGDADGGRLLPFGPRDPNNHRSTLSTAAVYFGCKDLRDRAGQFAEQTLWLLGHGASVRFRENEMSPAAPTETSKAFQQSGIVVMRNDWQSDANMLLFDAGPQGMNGCGHGHADALSIVCSAQNTNWLVDPGTYEYTTPSGWRDYFRSTQAHNTLVVDGQGQAEPLEPFKWLNVCHGRLERWVTLPNLDYASGVHEGYCRLAEPLLHRRRVVFSKPDRWFLLDDLIGTGIHSLDFSFHFSPEVHLAVEGPMCWATRNGSRFLLISDPRLSVNAVFGGEGKYRGWHSRDYGHRERAPVLVGAIRCSVPVRFPWVLWPGAPREARLSEISGHASAWRLQTDEMVEHFLFSNEVQNQRDPTATDAQFVSVRHVQSGTVARITLLDGSWMKLSGVVKFCSKRRVHKFELMREDNALEVLMCPVAPFTLALKGVNCVRLNGNQVKFKRTDDGITVQEGI